MPHLLRCFSEAEKALLWVLFDLFRHTFCKACLKEMLKPHKNPEHVSTCPLCRVPIDINKIGYDLIAIKIIDQL